MLPVFFFFFFLARQQKQIRRVLSGRRARGKGKEYRRTRLDVAMRIRPGGTARPACPSAAAATLPVLVAHHQRQLLRRLVVLVGARLFCARASRCRRRCRRAVLLFLFLATSSSARRCRHRLHALAAPGPGGAAGSGAAVDVHVAQGAADAEEEQHQLLLGEAGVVDEVRVDHVLQVPAAVVGQQHVDRLGARVAALARDAVVDAVDDAVRVLKQLVGLDLAHGLRHRLGPERASDLLERQQLRRRRVLDEVYVREAALHG